MKIRIKYRVHGMAEAVLQPGQVVDMDEAKALELIRQGVAVELDGGAGSPPSGPRGEGGANMVNLRVALAAKEAERDAAEKEVFTLRDEKGALEKQVAALKEALKKAKAKSTPEETRPEGG